MYGYYVEKKFITCANNEHSDEYSISTCEKEPRKFKSFLHLQPKNVQNSKLTVSLVYFNRILLLISVIWKLTVNSSTGIKIVISE